MPRIDWDRDNKTESNIAIVYVEDSARRNIEDTAMRGGRIEASKYVWGILAELIEKLFGSKVYEAMDGLELITRYRPGSRKRGAPVPADIVYDEVESVDAVLLSGPKIQGEK